MARSGRGSDGAQGREFAEFVRHALHAAGDRVEPSPDGLQRIRDKISSRRAHARFRLAVGVPVVLSFLADPVLRWSAALTRHWHALRHGLAVPGAHRAKPEQPRQARRPRDKREAILRPAFAVGFAVFTVGVVLAAVPPIRQEIFHSVEQGFASQSPASSLAPGSSAGGVLGGGAPVPTSAGVTGAAPAATCPSSSGAAAGSQVPASQNVKKSSPAVQSSSSTPPAVHSTASGSDSTTGTAGPGEDATATATGSPTVTVTKTPTPSHTRSQAPSTKQQSEPTPTGSCTSSSAPAAGATVNSAGAAVNSPVSKATASKSASPRKPTPTSQPTLTSAPQVSTWPPDKSAMETGGTGTSGSR